SLAIQRSGTKAQPVEGTYVQRGFLPRWLATFLGVFMALAITFVMLWLAYKPQVRSAATEKLQEAGISTLPAPTPSLATAPSSAPAQEPAPSRAQQNPDDGGGGGGGAVASPEATKKKASPGPLPASGVVLRNATTRKCADIPGYDKGQPNGPVREFVCDGTAHDNQLWNLEVREKGSGPEKSDLFQIRNVKDRLCVDLPDFGAKPPRTGVFEFQCDGTTADNQLWWLDKQESGHYWIRNYSSNHLCLDVSGYSTGGDDTPLTIFTCSNTDDQEWDIVHPS
ncbi:RICIN domain-containing protein, partial [Streptomyces sp. NPDC059466]